MVPPTQEPDTTDKIPISPERPMSPLELEARDSSRSEWPQLASFDGIDQDEVERTEWRNYEIPVELEVVEGELSQELQVIVRESLDQVLGSPVDINYGFPDAEDHGHGETPGSSARPLSIASSAAVSDTSDDSQNDNRSHTPSTSSSTLNIPGNLTNGQPTMKKGPLGWIVPHPDETEKTRKSRKPKEPKQDSGLKRFLKEKKAERSTGECASCMEDMSVKKLHALACTHKYCAPCFQQLIATAAQNENQFPPKCCLQEIPVKVILSSLPHEQKEHFKLKAQEYAVPASNRWYCPSTTCTKWIPLDKVKRRSNDQTCPHCRIAICGICRGTAHDANEDCPQDFGLDATLEEAEREGWRRCYRCRAMVELTVGCRHITCKCKAEFCYTCGAVWKTCACTEMDQARRHQEILDRRAERDRTSVADQAAAAAEAAEVAAAIAAVEEQERREEEERLRFEQQQREEEERRRELEAAAARLKEQARVKTINDKATELEGLLRDLHNTQRRVLTERHLQETNRLYADVESSAIAFNARQNLLRVTLRQNLKSRLQTLAEEQITALTTLSSRHEEEEDDLFVTITMRLRNNPNREAREKSMTEKLRDAQKKEMATLEEGQRHKKEELEWMGGIESRNLEDSLQLKRDADICTEGDKVALLVRSVWADRKWFETVTERREQMVVEWREGATRSGFDPAAPRKPEPEVRVELEAADASTARAASILTTRSTPTLRVTTNVGTEAERNSLPLPTRAPPSPSPSSISTGSSTGSNVGSNASAIKMRMRSRVSETAASRFAGYAGKEVKGRPAKVH